jgi:hypothetical protein
MGASQSNGWTADPLSRFNSEVCTCDSRMKCCDTSQEKKSISTRNRSQKPPEGFRYTEKLKKQDARDSPPAPSITPTRKNSQQTVLSAGNTEKLTRSSNVFEDADRRSNSAQSIVGLLLAKLKPVPPKQASQLSAEHSRNNRLFHCRKSEESSWIEIPSPLVGWSEAEQGYIIEAMREFPNYNKETGGLEKLITKARKNMPLKTHEDCIHCLQHLQASRVAYFYNK